MIAGLVYPHQLYAEQPAVAAADVVVLVEDPLFFSQYPFHKLKLMLHRASMKRYAERLTAAGRTVKYLNAADVPTTGRVVEHFKAWKASAAVVVDPNDDYLGRRLKSAFAGRSLTVLDDPHFLTPAAEIERFTAGKAKLFFTDFYIAQRKRLGVLVEKGKPHGGKWSFDSENRKKLPANVVPPPLTRPPEEKFILEAREYVRKHFPNALGSDDGFAYPTTHEQADHWLTEFIRQRLAGFGDYEDAITTRDDVLFHSLLTPMLNTGLLTPRQVLDAALAEVHRVPLNSLEGFVRQVIGWREFIRLVYRTHGRGQRTGNFWGFTAEMPAAFYNGTTGILPVDHVIRQVLRTGYCHHIERLMILGNFLLLCDVKPTAVYQWFMELFIDAYDWVMVPNVYGMSQHADGGLMTTKPYISGSSYVLKMSDHKKGPWCPIWDALYWRFVDTHRDFFTGNPRMAVMAKMCDKLGDKLTEHHRVADAFLKKLHQWPTQTRRPG